jgi:hypothetical protein
MKLHELKTINPYFKKMWNGTKLFDIRKNDRDYKVGDILWLREYDKREARWGDGDGYSGKEITYLIIDIAITANTFEGLTKDYCAMTLKELFRNDGYNSYLNG